ncbi:MAG TPA: hypothetical protein VMG12_36150 [Polyangiaceae bacterium]|nr:hypothetical protein [Polyangiaceae bacterium]
MTLPAPETFELQAVRLTFAAPHFSRLADRLILTLRGAMGVPAVAEPEVEAEFAALRQSLDSFYPEFTQAYAGLLSRYLGEAAPVVVAALDEAPVQAYLRAADPIEAEMMAALRALSGRVAAALMPSTGDAAAAAHSA